MGVEKRGEEEEGGNIKQTLSLGCCFVRCEIARGLSPKLRKLIENIYISVTGGRVSILGMEAVWRAWQGNEASLISNTG